MGGGEKEWPVAVTVMAAWRTLVQRSIWIVLALVLGTGLTQAQSTLETVKARGHVLCGTSDPLPGFAQRGADGLWTGFDVDFCRAVSAAVFGDPSKVQFRPLSGNSRFALLQTGALDLVVRNGAWTMRRDTSYGASFVGALFFDGQSFLVPASLGVVSAYELSDLRVCVLDGGDDLIALRDFFFQTQAAYSEVLYEDREDLAVAYQAGLCDAVSAPASWLYAVRRSLPSPAGHRILPERISKDAFGPTVREGDDEWYTIVQWTLFTLINAEEAGVTSRNIESLAAAKSQAIRRLLGIDSTFGPSVGLSPTFMKDIIGAVGNYGELFERNFGSDTGASMLRGQNALWINGGLLYAPPIH